MCLKSIVLGLWSFCCVCCANGQQLVAVARLGNPLVLLKSQVDLPAFYEPFASLHYPSDDAGGAASSPIILRSNKVYRGVTIDLKNSAVNGITGNRVNNVRITHCRIVNTKSFAILLNGCTNVTIDSCFISNVGFGVYAQLGSQAIKVNYNQILNVNGIDKFFLGHAIQFNRVNGGGSCINYNRIENIAGVALHPHDQINVYKSNGVVNDSIQVIGNWIRGGQRIFWPDSHFGAAGIVVGDVTGSYQVCRNNVIINSGAAGINAGGNGVNSISIDHNLIYNNLISEVAGNGIIIQGSSMSDIKVSFNRVWWINKYGNAVKLRDGETSYYLGTKDGTSPGVVISDNVWLDDSLNSSILPSVIITLK